MAFVEELKSVLIAFLILCITFYVFEMYIITLLATDDTKMKAFMTIIDVTRNVTRRYTSSTRLEF